MHNPDRQDIEVGGGGVPEFLSIQNLSQYLDIKVKTLYAMAEEGKIPHFKFGRLVRFRKSEIDRWVKKQKGKFIDPKKQVRKALLSIPGPERDIDRIVKKSIEGVMKEKYNSPSGKTGPIRRPQKGGL